MRVRTLAATVPSTSTAAIHSVRTGAVSTQPVDSSKPSVSGVSPAVKARRAMLSARRRP